MPCQELFDKQPESFKNEILDRRHINSNYRGWKYSIVEKIFW